MSKPTICDRCDIRIDTSWHDTWHCKNNTGVGETGRIDLCVNCHGDIKTELYALLTGETGKYEHPEEL